MARSAAALLLPLAFGATGASAAVTVIGSSPARLCYEAADSQLAPTPDDLGRCTAALADGTLAVADEVATYVNRGILRLRRGDIDGAVADFDSAIALDPSEPEAWFNKGAALIRRDDAAAALPLFTRALSLGPGRPALAHFGRAVANESLGLVRAAYADYRRASELEPDWDEPRRALRRFRIVSR